MQDFFCSFLMNSLHYISGDTVFIKEIERALIDLKPDISVVAEGCACLDVGGPILMTLSEIVNFVRLVSGKVIANHLEALNHCPIIRLLLREELEKNSLSEKVLIPLDGETFHLKGHRNYSWVSLSNCSK